MTTPEYEQVEVPLKYNYGRLEISGPHHMEIARMSNADAFRIALERESQAMQETILDWRDGPRLGPGRREYNEIMRPVWRRAELVARLASMGRPVGAYRRSP